MLTISDIQCGVLAVDCMTRLCQQRKQVNRTGPLTLWRVVNSWECLRHASCVKLLLILFGKGRSWQKNFFFFFFLWTACLKMKIGAAVMVLGRWFGLSRPFGTLGEEKICITAPLKQTRVCVVNFMKLFSREGFVTTKLDVVLRFRMSLVCVFSRKSASVSEQEPGTLCLRFCGISCLLVWIGGKFRVTAPRLSGIFFF